MMSERIDLAWNRVEAALYHLEKTVDRHRHSTAGLQVAHADIETMRKRVDHLVHLIEKRLESRPRLNVVGGTDAPVNDTPIN